MGALKVELYGLPIGTLEAFGDESQCFTFDDKYRDRFTGQRPILGQIFEDRFPDAIQVGGPICWFAHLLPQGVMRHWRSRLLDIDEDDTFGFLKQLGSDLPGAVVLTPTDSVLRTTPSQADAIATVKPDVSEYQFSLAGAQWKLSARSAGRGLTTTAISGGTSVIAKFHSPEYPGLPRCEFATMTWARESGVAIPDFELRRIEDFDQIPEEMPTGDGNVFVIERFDRAGDQRIHIEDFGQILDRPPGTRQTHGSYEELASVIKWIAPESREDYLKQLVFNIICGNGDAHLKNFSVIYRDFRHAMLSPAYDLVSTILYFSEGNEDLSLKLDGNREFRSIGLSSFDQLLIAMEFSIDDGRSLIGNVVQATLDTWNKPDIRSNYTVEQAARIDRHIENLSFCKPD